MQVEDTVTLSEAAKMLRVKPPKVRRLIKGGHIEAVKKGWVWLLSRADVEKQKRTR